MCFVLKSKMCIFVEKSHIFVYLLLKIELFIIITKRGDDVDTKSPKIKCVISYAHSDENLFKKFFEHLNAISRTYPLQIWTDRRIKAGQDIDKNIEKHFNEAEIIFILVSCAYVNSDYCYEKELEIAYRRHNASKCIIVPVILSKVATIDELPFHSINRVPQDGKPIRSFRPHDNGLNKADEMIVDLLRDFKIDNQNSQIDFSKLKKPNTQDATTQKSAIVSQSSTNSSKKNKSSVPTYKIVCEGEIVDKEITQNIILAMPEYFDNTYKFNCFANKVVSESVVNYKKEFNKPYNTVNKDINKLRFKNLRGLLFELSNGIQKYYVGDVNSRVHFRRLNGNQYEGIVVSGARNIISNAKNLTVMPAQRGMIFKSGVLSMPLLRSFNKTIHTSGRNDSIWIEHLTCTFSISNAITPILSMGISLNKQVVEDYTPILILMAYTRLDKRINEVINQYIDDCKKIDSGYELSKFIYSKF